MFNSCSALLDRNYALEPISALLDHNYALEPISALLDHNYSFPTTAAWRRNPKKSLDKKNIKSHPTFGQTKFRSGLLTPSTRKIEELILRKPLTEKHSKSTMIGSDPEYLITSKSATIKKDLKKNLLELYQWTCSIADSRISKVSNIIDLKGLSSNLDKDILSQFASFLKYCSITIIQEDASEIKDRKIQWTDPHCPEDGKAVGNCLLSELYFFDQIFFELTQKECLCEADLLEFKSTYLTFKNWHFFSTCFLGQPFFRSHLSIGVITNKSTLSSLHLARLLVFRYEKLLTTMMLIDKALGYCQQSFFYKQFSLAKLFSLKLSREIRHFSIGIPLPNDFWNSCVNFANWLEIKD